MNMFHSNQAEHFNSMKHLNNQNYEITTVANEKFVTSLSQHAQKNFQIFNTMKGGSE